MMAILLYSSDVMCTCLLHAYFESNILSYCTRAPQSTT